MRMKVLLAALLLMCSSSLVMAADYYVDITNRTGYTIYYMYPESVKPAPTLSLSPPASTF